MRITYYALKPLQVGEDIREPGDLVPEAGDWKYLSGYVSDGSLAPVLVATLPEAQQVMLLEWEDALVQEALGNGAPVSQAAPEQQKVEPPKVTPEAQDKQTPKPTPKPNQNAKVK